MASHDLLDIFGDAPHDVNCNVDNPQRTPEHAGSPDPFGNIDFTGAVKSCNETIKDPQTIEQTLLSFDNDAPVHDGSDVTETLIGLNGDASYDSLPLTLQPQQVASAEENSDHRGGTVTAKACTDKSSTVDLVDTFDSNSTWEHQLGNKSMLDSLVDFGQTPVIDQSSPQADSQPDLLFGLDYPKADVNGPCADTSPVISTEASVELIGDDPFGLFVPAIDGKSSVMDISESDAVVSPAVSNSDILLSVNMDEPLHPEMDLSGDYMLNAEVIALDGQSLSNVPLSDTMKHIENEKQDLKVEAPVISHTPSGKFQEEDTSHGNPTGTSSLEDLKLNMQSQGSAIDSIILTNSAADDYPDSCADSLLCAGTHESKSDSPSLNEHESVSNTTSAPAETTIVSQCVDSNINEGGGIDPTGYGNVSTHTSGKQSSGEEFSEVNDAAGLDFPNVESEKSATQLQYSYMSEVLQKDLVEEKDMDVAAELKINAEKEAHDVLEKILSLVMENVCDRSVGDVMEYLIFATENNSQRSGQEAVPAQGSENDLLDTVGNVLECLVDTVEGNSQHTDQRLNQMPGFENETLTETVMGETLTETVMGHFISTTTEDNLQHSDSVPQELDNAILGFEGLKVENSETSLIELPHSTNDKDKVNLLIDSIISDDEKVNSIEQRTAEKSISGIMSDNEEVEENNETTELCNISPPHTPDVSSTFEPVDSLIGLVEIQKDSSGTQSQSSDNPETTTHFKSKQGSDDITSTVLKPFLVGPDCTGLEADLDSENFDVPEGCEQSLSQVTSGMSGIGLVNIEVADIKSESGANTDCVTLPEVKHVTVDGNQRSDTDHKVEGEVHLPEDIKQQCHEKSVGIFDINDTPTILGDIEGEFDAVITEQDGCTDSSERMEEYRTNTDESVCVLHTEIDIDQNNGDGDSNEDILNPDWSGTTELGSTPTKMEIAALGVERGATAPFEQCPGLHNGNLEDVWQQQIRGEDTADGLVINKVDLDHGVTADIQLLANCNSTTAPQPVDFGEQLLPDTKTDTVEMLGTDPIDSLKANSNSSVVSDFFEQDKEDIEAYNLETSEAVNPTTNPLTLTDSSDNHDNLIEEKDLNGVLPSQCQHNLPEADPDLVPSSDASSTNTLGRAYGVAISLTVSAEGHEDDPSVCDSLDGEVDDKASPEPCAVSPEVDAQGFLELSTVNVHDGVGQDSKIFPPVQGTNALEQAEAGATMDFFMVENRSSDETEVDENAVKPVSDFDGTNAPNTSPSDLVHNGTSAATDFGSPVQSIDCGLQSLISENNISLRNQSPASDVPHDAAEAYLTNGIGTDMEHDLQTITPVTDGLEKDDVSVNSDSGSAEFHQFNLEVSRPEVTPLYSHQENTEHPTNHLLDKNGEFSESKETTTATESVGGHPDLPPVAPLRKKKSKDVFNQSPHDECVIKEQVVESKSFVVSNEEKTDEFKSMVLATDSIEAQTSSITDVCEEIVADLSMMQQPANDVQILHGTADFGTEAETAALLLEPNDLNDASKHLSTGINYSSVKFEEELDFDAKLGHSSDTALCEIAVADETASQGPDDMSVMDEGHTDEVNPSSAVALLDASAGEKTINSFKSGDTSACSEIPELVVGALSTQALDNKEEIAAIMAETNEVSSDLDEPVPEIDGMSPSHLEGTETRYFENEISRNAEDQMHNGNQTEETISIINNSEGVEDQMPSFMIDDVPKNPTGGNSPSGHDTGVTADSESSNPPDTDGVQLDADYNEEQETREATMQNHGLDDHENINIAVTNESLQSIQEFKALVSIEDEQHDHLAPIVAQDPDDRPLDTDFSLVGGVDLNDSCQVSDMEFDDDPYSEGMDDHAASITNEAIRRRNVHSKQHAPLTSSTGYVSGHSYSAAVPSSVFIDALSDSDSADDSLEVNTSSSGEENDSESDDNLYGSPVYDTPMLGFIEATNEGDSSISHPLSPYMGTGTYQGFDAGWEDIAQSQGKFIALPVIMEEPEPSEAEDAVPGLYKIAEQDTSGSTVADEDMEAEMDQIIDDVADTLVDIIERIVCMETFHDTTNESDADYSDEDDADGSSSFAEDSESGSLEISGDEQILPDFSEDTSWHNKTLPKLHGNAMDPDLQPLTLPDEEKYDESLDGSNVSVDGSQFSDRDFDVLSEEGDSSEVENDASKTDETPFLYQNATDAESESEFRKAPEAEMGSCCESKTEEAETFEPNTSSELSEIEKSDSDIQIATDTPIQISDKNVEPVKMDTVSESLVRLAKFEALEELSQHQTDHENDEVAGQESAPSEEFKRISIQTDAEKTKDEYFDLIAGYGGRNADAQYSSSAEEDDAEDEIDWNSAKPVLDAESGTDVPDTGSLDSVHNAVTAAEIGPVLDSPDHIGSATTHAQDGSRNAEAQYPSSAEEDALSSVTMNDSTVTSAVLSDDKDVMINPDDDHLKRLESIAAEPQIANEITFAEMTANQKSTELGLQSLPEMDTEVGPSEESERQDRSDYETFGQTRQVADSESVDMLPVSSEDTVVNEDVPPPPPSRKRKPKVHGTVESETLNENAIDLPPSRENHVEIGEAEDMILGKSGETGDDTKPPPAPPTRKHKTRKPDIGQPKIDDSDTFESSEKESNEERVSVDVESPLESAAIEAKESLHGESDHTLVTVSDIDIQQSDSEDSNLLAADAAGNHDVVELTSQLVSDIRKDTEHESATSNEHHKELPDASSDDHIGLEAKPEDEQESSAESETHTGMSLEYHSELESNPYNENKDDNVQHEMTEETRPDFFVDRDSGISGGEHADASENSDSDIPLVPPTAIDSVDSDTGKGSLEMTDDITSYCQELVLGLLDEAFARVSNMESYGSYENKEEENSLELSALQEIQEGSNVRHGETVESERNGDINVDFTHLTRSPGDGSEDFEGQVISDSDTLESYTEGKTYQETIITEYPVLEAKLETEKTEAGNKETTGTATYSMPLKDSETVSIGSAEMPCQPRRIRHDTTGSLGSIRYLTDSEDEDEENPKQSKEETLVSLDDDPVVDESMPHTIITDFATPDEPLTTVQQRTKKKSLVPPSSLILSVALDDMPVAEKQERLPGVPVLEEDLIQTPSTPDESKSLGKVEDSAKLRDVMEPPASAEIPTLILQNQSSTGESQPVVQTQIKLIKPEDIIPTAPMPSLDRKVEWEMVTVKNVDYKIDGAAIQPYKKVISHGGFYDEKSPIIEVFTSYLPNSNIQHYAWVMDNLFLYVLATIELLAQENFSVVMFVGSTPKSQIPANSLLKRWHQHVDYRLKKNVEAFYIMNPTLYFRTMARLFVSRKVLKKMKYIKSMTELKTFIPTEFLFVPAEIAR